MRTWRIGIGGLLASIVLLTTTSLAQPPGDVPAPSSLYAHDLKVRKGGSSTWKGAESIGVEFFVDKATGTTLLITQNGNLAVVPGTEVSKDRKAEWQFAHDLRARKGKEDQFTESTAKFGVEAFKDAGTNQLLYIADTSSIAVTAMPAKVGKDQEPKWHHALSLKVRKSNEPNFTNDTTKFGLEAFKDGNTGGLIYISETGSLAAAPAPAQPPASDKIKGPTALYGLTLQVRKASEKEFSPETKRIGIEVFRDENTGNLLYISETGSLATAPAVGDAKSGQGVTWKRGMSLRARPGGVTEFNKATAFGVEVFQDNNSGHMVFISETGSIAVLAKK